MKVRVHGGVNTREAVEIVETVSTTWSELKDELQSKGIMNSNHFAVIRENQVVMNLGGYVLPTGIGEGRGRVSTDAYDFTLMLTTDKIDGGMASVNIADIEASIKLLRENLVSLQEETNSEIDGFVEDLISDGLEIVVENTYPEEKSNRVVDTVKTPGCDDCDELEAFKKSITRR